MLVLFQIFRDSWCIWVQIEKKHLPKAITQQHNRMCARARWYVRVTPSTVSNSEVGVCVCDFLSCVHREVIELRILKHASETGELQ